MNMTIQTLHSKPNKKPPLDFQAAACRDCMYAGQFPAAI
jgi:hypothetical protein